MIWPSRYNKSSGPSLRRVKGLVSVKAVISSHTVYSLVIRRLTLMHPVSGGEIEGNTFRISWLNRTRCLESSISFKLAWRVDKSWRCFGSVNPREFFWAGLDNSSDLLPFSGLSGECDAVSNKPRRLLLGKLLGYHLYIRLLRWKDFDLLMWFQLCSGNNFISSILVLSTVAGPERSWGPY